MSISIPQLLRMVSVCKHYHCLTLPQLYQFLRLFNKCSWLLWNYCSALTVSASQNGSKTNFDFSQKNSPTDWVLHHISPYWFCFLVCHKLDNLLEEVPSWLWLLEQSRGVPSLKKKKTSMLHVQRCSLCSTVGAFKEYCLCHLSWKLENKFNLHVGPKSTRDMCCRAFYPYCFKQKSTCPNWWTRRLFTQFKFTLKLCWETMGVFASLFSIRILKICLEKFTAVMRMLFPWFTSKHALLLEVVLAQFDKQLCASQLMETALSNNCWHSKRVTHLTPLVLSAACSAGG